MKRLLQILVLLSTVLAASVFGAAPASAGSYGKYCPTGGYPNVPYCILDIESYWGGPTVNIYVDTAALFGGTKTVVGIWSVQSVRSYATERSRRTTPVDTQCHVA